MNDDGLVASSSHRLCFQCGGLGHKMCYCTSSERVKNDEGKESVKRFNDNRKRNHNHFEKVVRWMAKSKSQEPSERTVVDPLLWLRSQAPTSIDGNCVTQRSLDMHRAKYNDLDKAQRTLFGGTIAQLKARLTERLNVSPEDEGASQWHKQLTRAVELGQPAEFSSNNSDEQSIKVYAVEKLQPRCRQLHHLIFHDNSFCAKIRKKLLPSAKESLTTNCISIGGGPGFDHVSFCIAAKFLHDIQPQRSELLPNRIKTEVYDLYSDDWKPVMEALGECFEDRDHLTMHHVDLRLDLADEAHAQLRSSLHTVDIICLQFVLHENSSFLVKEVEIEGVYRKQINGVMRDILTMAPAGTIMIITDSANTLFPYLKDAANEHGWTHLCAEEQLRKEGKRRAYLGPKSFLILERKICK
eukprot:scaffold488_cov142-Skeletonema_menzelii.AAC.15